MRLLFHPLARVEIDGAIDHYRAIAHRLAKRLRDELDAVFEEIGSTPERWGYYEPLAEHRRWRRRMTTGFPYVIIYEVIPEGVRVVAVAHTARRPGYWRAR